MARQTTYQTPTRTYNPFDNYTVGETSQHVRSTSTRIVVDNDGRVVYLNKSSHDGRRQDEQQPIVKDARDILLAIRGRSDTYNGRGKEPIRGGNLEGDYNRASDEADDRERLLARRNEATRLRDEKIRRRMRELNDREREFADERRRLNQSLGRGTPLHNQSPHRRSPLGDRSPRKRSRSRNGHNHRTPAGPPSRSPPRRNSTPHDDGLGNNGGRENNRGHGDGQGNSGGGRESNNNGEYGGNDVNYHCRRNDYNKRNNDDNRRWDDDDGRGYNNTQPDEAALLRDQLIKLELKVQQTYCQLGRTIHAMFGYLLTRDNGG